MSTKMGLMNAHGCIEFLNPLESFAKQKKFARVETNEMSRSVTLPPEVKDLFIQKIFSSRRSFHAYLLLKGITRKT